ncbi:MAG TPA: Kazal-type serine protease inhibitor [bacterium]|nr:Kazal-type serine protease inhibitor [bacterium]
MYSKRFFAFLSVAILLFVGFAASTYAAFSVADQAIVDRAVGRIERLIETKGESSRAKIVSRLRELQLRYATDERVRKYMPRIIYFVQNPDATSYPAGAGYVDPIVVPEESATGSDTPTACTMEYAPVCGVDNTTYGNACMADGAGTTIAHAGACVDEENSSSMSGSTGSAAESSCDRGQLIASGACTSAYSPIIISTASSDSPSLGIGTQYLSPFSIRAASQYASIKRLVFQINAVIAGKSIDSAVYREYGLSNEYDNVFQSSADGNSKISGFALLVNGLNTDSVYGVSYRAVKSGSQLYLVVDFERRLVISTTPTNLELKMKLSSATTNDYLRIAIPSLATNDASGTPDELKTGVSETSVGSASIIWSPQTSASHGESSDDYFTDWSISPGADGDILPAITYVGR